MTAVIDEPLVLDNLNEEEAYLYAILSDPSGLDQAEFLWVDESSDDNRFCPYCGTERVGVHTKDHPELDDDDWVAKYPSPSGCFRAWAYQWPWWRSGAPQSVDQCARSVGKSLSIKVRSCAFPFLYPGQEMVITAPELIHLEPITGLVENQMYTTRFLREMLPRGKSAVTHRPFLMNFLNGARLIGRIPQRDGKGLKGCVAGDTPILTSAGLKTADQVEVGDYVLTHEGRYQPVTHVFEDTNDCYEVRGQSSFPLTVSCDHRFFGAENEATPKQKRRLLPLGWHDVEHLIDHQVHWATPMSFPELPIPWPDAPFEMRSLTYDFWWLVGRYLADGYFDGRRIIWFVPPPKQDAMYAALDRLLVHHYTTERAHSSAAGITVCSKPLGRWLVQHFGARADGKTIPAWALGMDVAYRQALLDGYIAGDGHFDAGRKRWQVSTASKALAVGAQLLAQSLGYTVNCSIVQPKTTEIAGVALKAKPKLAYFLQIVPNGRPVAMAHLGPGYPGGPVPEVSYVAARVRSIEPVGKRKIYDIRVAEDHSYLTGTIMSHNIHPVWLEVDEAQDMPHAAWIEVNETVKKGVEGWRWKVHGVTKGVRDDFYRITQDVPGNSWRIHRYAAMWRPTWTSREREQAVERYGSREDPDYRRNVLGLHGDKTNPIFVLTTFMKCVDTDELSDYNRTEYFKVAAKSEQLELFGQEMIDLLDFPRSHLAHAGETDAQRLQNPKATFWAGMDIGFTVDPSEIIVCVEHRPKPSSPKTVLRTLTRISMTRMPHHEQLKTILHVIAFYRPKAFSMDKTGLGLPIYQELQEYVTAYRANDLDHLPLWAQAYDLETALTVIKGYNFSEKLLVDLDQSVQFDEYDDHATQISKAGLKRNAKEFSTDYLRELVDDQRLLLPWDDDLLKQFQGGTWASSRSMDAYGRRIFSRGNDHVLDAYRMLVTGFALHQIEQLTRTAPAEPVYDTFVML
jgi:hypothetical protein